jgi:hypothetical protein
MGFERVRSGDVITADLVNRMLNALDDLADQVQVLSSGFVRPNEAPRGGFNELPVGAIDPGRGAFVAGGDLFAITPDDSFTIDGQPVSFDEWRARLRPGVTVSGIYAAAADVPSRFDIVTNP